MTTTRWTWAWPALWTVGAVSLGLLAERGPASHQPGRPGPVVADLIGGLVFAAAGLVVRRARPGNRCWWLLMATGATWFVGSLQASLDPDLSLAGFALGIWHYAFLAWLLLAYPTGRLPGRRERGLVGVVAVLCAVRTLSRLFLYVPPDGTGCACAPNRFVPLTDPRWYDAVDRVFPWALSVTFLLVVAGALDRWRRSSRAGRRMLAPVLIAAATVSLQVSYDYVVRNQVGLAVPSRVDLYYLVVAARAATAVAFVIGLWRLRTTRSAVVDLVGGLDGNGTPTAELGTALRRALGDPSVELVPWSPDAGAFVDPSGRRLALPVTDRGRAVTVIEQDGNPVAALMHDEALLEDPGLVSAVAAAVRLTSDNEHLRAQLQHQLEQVAASRSRIVAAGDAERRRIERDLHDGAQQRLVTIALALRLTEARMGRDADRATRKALRQAVEDLGGAVAELRDLARGIHPAILSESGLEAAVTSLVDRAPLRVRREVQLSQEPPRAVAAAAYFAVSEALTNVLKHARATDILVQVTSVDGTLRVVVADDGVGGADRAAGSGLSGLADRVDAAGGSLHLVSPQHGGTRLEVELPCG